MTSRMSESQVEHVSRLLARHYGYDENNIRACACTGLSGVCIDCPRWWSMLLDKTDEQSMEEIFNLAVVATRAAGILG